MLGSFLLFKFILFWIVCTWGLLHVTGQERDISTSQVHVGVGLCCYWFEMCGECGFHGVMVNILDSQMCGSSSVFFVKWRWVLHYPFLKNEPIWLTKYKWSPFLHPWSCGVWGRHCWEVKALFCIFCPSFFWLLFWRNTRLVILAVYVTHCNSCGDGLSELRPRAKQYMLFIVEWQRPLRLSGSMYLKILWFGRSLFTTYELTTSLPDDVLRFLYLSLEVPISFSFLSFIENLLYARPCIRHRLQRLMRAPVLNKVLWEQRWCDF